MKKLRPGDGPGRGGDDVDEQKPLFQYTAYSSPSTFTRLDALARAECRRLWWRLRRQHGVALPAQVNVILYRGGADPDRPRPRTMEPEPEAGRPGGGR